MGVEVIETRNPSIQSLIDMAVIAKRERDGYRETAGGARWRASNLGYCLRSQTLEARGVPALKDFPLEIQRRFSVGNTFAEWVKQTFEELGILLSVEQPLYDKELDLGAHCDFLIGGQVHHVGRDLGAYVPFTGVELKSVHSRSWWHAKEKGGRVAGHHQMIQAAAQGMLWERLGKEPKVNRWMVLSISKDDLTVAEDYCEPDHFAEARRRVENLNYFWNHDLYPPCTCYDDMGGMYWKYCRYYEGTDKSKRGKDAKPDGPCCQPREGIRDAVPQLFSR